MATENEPKSVRKQMVLEQEDLDILDFFSKSRGLDASSTVRFALRALYEARTEAIPRLGRPLGALPGEPLKEVDYDTGEMKSGRDEQ